MSSDGLFIETRRASWQVQPTRIHGRESELATLELLIAGANVHLVTVIGPAGVGKTRLAAELGMRLADRFPASVHFVNLAPVRDPNRVLTVIAQAAGIQNLRDTDLDAQLREHLRDRSALLILDNFEHLLAAAPHVATLLSALPGLKLVVTSREPLHLRWEHTYRVSPLALPDPSDFGPLSELAAVPSITLFLERVRAVNAEFRLTGENARAVAEICIHLDGLPLAIELAAARSVLLSPQMILERMEGRLSLLYWHAPDLPERQQTLRSALDWSYSLLTESEQNLLRHLGVFVGGFDLEAVEAIARRLPHCRISALEGLSSLAEKCLIQVTGLGQDRVRYSLLESIREYARELLGERDELEIARRAHAAYFLELAKQADPEVRTQSQDIWMSRLEQERDNLEAALRRLVEYGENEDALSLAAALGYFWAVSGRLVDGWHWLNLTLQNAAHAHPAVRCAALAQAGLILVFKGDYQCANDMLDQSRRLASEIGASHIMARSLTYLCLSAAFAGDWDTTTRLLQEALDVWEQRRDLQEVGFALRYLSAVSFMQQALQQVAPLLEHVGDRFHAQGETLASGLAYLYLALTVRGLGDLPRAVEHLEAGIQASLECQDQRLLSLGVDAALRLVGDGTEMAMRARLSGARDALNAATGVTHSVWEQWSARQDARVRAELEREGYGAAYREGQSLSADETVARVREMLGYLSPPSPRSNPPLNPPPQQTVLSKREFEVLQLVAEGCSSKAIGELLAISVSTVNYHLTSIFNKLGVDTRAQAVGAAVRQGWLQPGSRGSDEVSGRSRQGVSSRR